MKIVDPQIKPQLWLTPPVAAFVTKLLSNITDAKILEFGSGCSTAFFAQYTPNLISIEHSAKWHQIVLDYLVKNKIQVDLRLITNNYYQECETLPSNYFDLILIDGQHRMNCLRAARNLVKPGGVIMLDDSEMNEKYLVANDIMQDWPKTKVTGHKGNPLNPSEEIEISTATWWIRPMIDIKHV